MIFYLYRCSLAFWIYIIEKYPVTNDLKKKLVLLVYFKISENAIFPNPSRNVHFYLHCGYNVCMI